MKKFGIQSSMVTMLELGRYELITKEKAKEVWDGKAEHEYGPPWGEISINDDLENFRRNLLNSKEIKVGCKQFSIKKNFD